MKQTLCVFLIALMLAGCIQGGKPDNGAALPQDSNEDAAFVQDAVWDGCRGLRVGIPGVRSMFTFDPAPPGWESTNPLTEFDLRLYECDHVSWGNLERGPVQMLVELGGDFDSPEACNGDNATLLRNMAAWWFSDADLAQFAATAYGIKAYATNFTIDRQEQAGIVDQIWRWGDAAAPSNLRFIDANAPASETTHVTRIFWFADNRTYAMDWSETWLFPTGSTQGSALHPASGRLEDPMLYSSNSSFNDFVGRAERYEGMQMAANFVRYDDYSCG